MFPLVFVLVYNTRDSDRLLCAFKQSLQCNTCSLKFK